jgi:hypothetical protein
MHILRRDFVYSGLDNLKRFNNMHDKNGQPLKVGDIVVVKCVVKEVSATPDFCNCQLETVEGRRPDGKKETIYAINTGVVEKL